MPGPMYNKYTDEWCSVKYMKGLRHLTDLRRGESVYTRTRSVYGGQCIISDRLPDDQPNARKITTINDIPDDLLCHIIEFFNVDILMEISRYNENQWTAPIEKTMPRVFQKHFPRLRVDDDTLWNAHGVWPEKFEHGPFKGEARTFSLTRHFRSMMRLSISTTTCSDKADVADQWPWEDRHSWKETKRESCERLKDRTEARWYIHVCYVCERTFRCVPDRGGYAQEDDLVDGDDQWFDVNCDCLQRSVRKSFIVDGRCNQRYFNTALTACSNECYWSLRENLELLNTLRHPYSQYGRPPFYYSFDLELRPLYDGENIPPYITARRRRNDDPH